jgi:salicylate hydroxylase
MYRWLTPMDKLLSHPSTAASWTNESPGFVFFSKGALTVITYPCRNNTLLNCALVHPTRPSEQHKDSWNSPSDHANVLELLEGCHDVVRSLPLAAEEIKVYTMTQRPPSSRISRGNMLCIGDTTHHMLPTHAQGGSQALEDAAALEILFSTSTSSLSSPYTHTPANLTSRLKLYKLLRLPRSATTQILSSTHPDYTLSNVNKKTAEIRRFYQGELPDWPLGVDRFSKPLKDFFWSYDVFEQAGRAVKWWDEEGQNKRVENGKEMEIPVGCFKWFGTLSGESQIKKPSNLVFE